MSELRRDPIIGQWVIVSNENSWGPEAYEKEDHLIKQAATCQFCPGREHQTPPEIEALRPAHSAPNTPGWTMRIIPNKFPALTIHGNLDKRGLGIFDVSNGVGAHEVLIETPDHSKNLVDFSHEELLNVLRGYQSRCSQLAGDKRFKYIMIFKNFGESAGASLEHTHSQIIALPMIPKTVLEELEGAREYFAYRGRCVYCDMIHQEYYEKERIVTENEDFTCFCPFVPRYPFESWIFPKKHASQFLSMSGGEQNNLAGILKDILSRIKGALSNPSYNFYLHISPVNTESHDSFHWHIEIVPKLTRVAGFEWGTGFYVVKTSPKHAAQILRDVKY